jgi:chorismate dehydratase
MEMVPQVPTQLNQSMLEGQIDIGPVSSFAYGLHPDRYMLYPNLSVSSLGEVGSIFLFLKKPIDQVKFGRVALPSTSASSVALLRVLLEKFYEGQPTYETFPPQLDHMLETHDAALLIGDDALQAKRDYPQLEVLDLGEEWYRWTGAWMTFAVWAIQKEIVQHQPELVEKCYESFLWSKQQGQHRLHEVIDMTVKQFGGTASYWKHYFTTLNYDFGSEHVRGLELFYDYAFEIGLLPQPTKVELWSPRQPVQQFR